MESLNKDVFAGDVLRREYRRQMDEHARLASAAEECRHELERIEADRQTAADRATSIMETLNRYGGMHASDNTAPMIQGEEKGR